MIIEAVKKYIVQSLLVLGILGYLWHEHTSTENKLTEARQEVRDLKSTRERLENEVEGLKEQIEIDTKAASKHGKAQGALDVKQAVAIEKVQHEVTTLLQEAPVETRGTKPVVDAVSAAVIDGMWRSYDDSIRGETSSSSE